MDSGILLGFIEEGETLLPTIRGGILLCSQKGKPKKELEVSIKHLHTLKGASAMIGLKEISKCSEDLEQDLKSLRESADEVTDKKVNAILDKLVKLEEQISKLRFGLDEFEFDASSLIEESFDNLQIEENPNEELIRETIVEEDSFEDFEIDEEMLEIFAMEAEDHLRNINEHLELLEQDPNNREALLEIRRSSHTLKGSAGIVGLKTLSNLAHKVEDLLDYISDNNIESNVEIFHLLLSATDCISAVTNDETSDELSEKISRTQIKLEELLKELQGSDTIDHEVVEPTPEFQTDSKASNKPKKELEALADSIPPIHSTVQPHSRSVIRVSLDRLDDLVKLVGEMVFSRSVFEQRLYELEQQIYELQNSTRRMRHSTGKLETGFDLGIPVDSSFEKHSHSSFANTSKSFGSSFVKTENESREFDSLEFDRYTEFNQTTRELIETTNDALSINSELDSVHNNLEMIFDNQKHLIDEMQEKLLSLRMVSFGTLSARLQRTVRVTAEEEDKLVDLVVEGENLEVDTQILDSLVEPLLHLLRNAVAHGIEPPETRRLLGKNERGKITLDVYSEGTHIVLTITDDGRGISHSTLLDKAVDTKVISTKKSLSLNDNEILSLIFLPGLTTADEISQVSGRGVGMNIVKTNIERQKGTISISSELQKGTSFTLRLPMALAVTRSLLVQANNQIYAFPLKLVKRISEISTKNLGRAMKEKMLRLGDTNYNVSHLNELLGVPVKPNISNQDVPILLLETLKKPCALFVDKIIKPQEIVIKPLDEPLKNVRSLLGASLLGDGSVIPVLDLVYLLDEQSTIKQKSKSKVQLKIKEKLTVMIVDDSPSVRHVSSTLVKNNNWEPLIARDGLEALDVLNSLTKLPDIILTDVEMPEMDGYELLASLKLLDKIRDIPVVMITSRASDKHRLKAFDLGVSDYITKPYDEIKLIETIKNLSS